MADDVEAANAIADLNGKEVAGRNLRVREAAPASNAACRAGALSPALAPGKAQLNWCDREVLMNERDLMFPDWQLQYFDALSGGSSETLRERVENAERAILIRLRNLASRPEREMERFAIKDALDTLHAIKINKMALEAKETMAPDSWTNHGVMYTIDAKAGVGGVITAQKENARITHSRIVSKLLTREETEKLFSDDPRSTKAQTPSPANRNTAGRSL